MSFQRKWLLAVPAVMVAMAMVWIVARPTEESASRSRSADADIAPTPARAREPGLSSVLDSVDLSDRASAVLVEPDDRPPLPPGYIAPDPITLPRPICSLATTSKAGNSCTSKIRFSI